VTGGCPRKTTFLEGFADWLHATRAQPITIVVIRRRAAERAFFLASANVADDTDV